MSGAPIPSANCMNAEDAMEMEVLCDAGAAFVPFIRFYNNGPSGPIVAYDTDFDGNPYTVIGPVGLCATDIEITPDPTADMRAGRVVLSGIGSWRLGVDDGGGKVKSVTFRRRPGGTPTSVRISDDFGNIETLLSGESETWSISALEDELTGNLAVTTTDVGDEVVVLWTEV